jgi:thiol reductant ABC exporter CydC subunit
MDLTRLRRWLTRSRPPIGRLLSAVLISILAALASILLLGGSGLLVGRAAGGGGLATLGGLLILIELVAFLRAPLRFEERLITHQVALGSMVRWRVWLYDTVAPRTPGTLSFVSSGDLLDRSIEDIDTLEDLYVRVALPLLGALVTGITAAVVVGIFLWSAGLVLFGALILGMAASVSIAAGSATATKEATRLRAAVAARVVDLVDGSADLAMAGATARVSADVSRLEAQSGRQEGRIARLRGAGIAILGLISGASILCIALLGASAVHHGTLTSAEAAGITLASVAGVEPLVGALLGCMRAANVDAAAARLEELEAAPLPVVEPVSPSPWPSGARALRFEAVTAAPAVGADPLLHGVSLSLAAGQHIAIVGASGSGKSTLCKLAMRFIDPLEGQLLVDDTPMSSLRGDDVRRNIVMLDQSPTLLAGTLADSLRLGDEEASDEALISVLAACQLTELVPEGVTSLNRPIAESGSSLSIGQQRRVALARALLRRPTFLLLDEPTAGLDDVQARAVLTETLRLVDGAGVLFVTHDLELAHSLDEVYWLHDGRLERLLDVAVPTS